MTTIYLQNTDQVLVDEGYIVGLPKNMSNEYGIILQYITSTPPVLLFILNYICKGQAYRISCDKILLEFIERLYLVLIEACR